MDIAGRAAAAAAGLGRDVVRVARRDRMLYAIALTVCLTGFAMQPYTGLRPDWDVVGRVFVKLGIVGAMAVAVLVIWRLVLARARRPKPDAGAATCSTGCGGFVTGPGLAVNAASTILIFCLYAGGFSVLKGAIAVVSPFAWDAALAELDRALHFGRLPHEWLGPLLRPLPVAVLNVGYNLWFFLLVVGWLGAAVAIRRPGLRHQYLMAFMLTWFVGGFLVACGFSSAGPCYYARIGLGDALRAADGEAARRRGGVRHLGGRDPGHALGTASPARGPARPGISAFPSMHVASATLFVLAARHLGRAAFVAAVALLGDDPARLGGARLALRGRRLRGDADRRPRLALRRPLRPGDRRRDGAGGGGVVNRASRVAISQSRACVNQAVTIPQDDPRGLYRGPPVRI